MGVQRSYSSRRVRWATSTMLAQARQPTAVRLIAVALVIAVLAFGIGIGLHAVVVWRSNPAEPEWNRLIDAWWVWLTYTAGPTALILGGLWLVNWIRAPGHLDGDRVKQICSALTRVDELESRLSPIIHVGYDPAEAACNQFNPMVDKAGTQVAEFRLFRVYIWCEGTAYRNVGVKLESHDPQQSSILPANLHIRHDNPPAGTPWKESFDLNPGFSARQYIDVVEGTFWDNKKNILMHVYFADAGLRKLNPLGDGDYTFKLSVQSPDLIEPLDQSYRVSLHSETRVSFGEILAATP